MSKQVYVLKQDLPDAKAGDEYILRGDMYRPLTAEQSNSPVIETNSYFRWQVEGNDKFFLPKKEESPQEWEILSLVGANGSLIYKEGYTFPECFQTLVNAKHFPIHSVRRLSDNTVFSIGDKVDCRADDGKGFTDTITEFIMKPELCVRFKDANSLFDIIWLCRATKWQPQPPVDTDTPFQWNDALIKEMLYSKLPLPDHYAGNVQKCLDEFKRKIPNP